MKIVESLLGFKEKKSAVLQQRNSIFKLLIIYNIPSTIILWLFNYYLPKPYMDEQFHYRQFLQFYNGNYQHWDPKITTPPGLYYLQWALSFLLGNSLSTIRAINALLFSNLYLLFALKIYDFKDLCANNLSRSLNLALTPTIFFFTFLDYTDAASLAFLTMMYYYSLVGSEYRLGVCSLLAVYVRQNNVIWVLYLIVYRVLNDHKKQLNNHRSFLGHLFGVVRILFNNKIALLKQFKLQLLVLGVVFGYIHFLNEGKLVFGDHLHHKFTFHPNQFLYLSIFIVLNVPISLGEYLSSLHKCMQRLLLSRHSLSGYLFLLSLSIIAVDQLTVVHPFITDDNRHFLFYFHRYFFQYSIFRYSLCLIYPLFLNFLMRLVVNSELKMLAFVLWTGSSFVYLCFGSLVQFRYFTIPFVIYSFDIENKNLGIDVEGVHRDENRDNNKEKMIWSNLAKGFINIVTIGVFLGMPFENEFGSGRFMW